MTDYFARLKEAAGRLKLRIEGPLDTGDRESQAEALSRLTAMADMREDMAPPLTRKFRLDIRIPGAVNLMSGSIRRKVGCSRSGSENLSPGGPASGGRG